MARLLLIEDNKEIAAFIQKGMSEALHTIDWADNGKDGLFLATTQTYDALIIDRMLPALDGLTVIKTLRGSGNAVPVLVLSALAEVDDRVTGLRAGGDDYLTKPFAFSELLARMEVLIRRGRTTGANGSAAQTELTAKDLKLDLLSRKVYRSGREIDLQPREFRLLEYMMRHKNQVITRTMLLEHVWDYNFDPQTNVIDVHISRLRNKIDKDFDNPIIRTIRGAGYTIEDAQ
jgi:two-component system OmpR family response regulator